LKSTFFCIVESHISLHVFLQNIIEIELSLRIYRNHVGLFQKKVDKQLAFIFIVEILLILFLIYNSLFL
jgi:hypothetical protein